MDLAVVWHKFMGRFKLIESISYFFLSDDILTSDTFDCYIYYSSILIGDYAIFMGIKNIKFIW